MNVMLGSVLSLWHDAREDGTYVPDDDTLKEASRHTDIDSLVIEGNTAFISDEKASIDVGAFAKGYATEKAAEFLRSRNADGYVLNIGGNICIIGTRPDGTGWVTAIKDPKSPSDGYCEKLDISDTSCVTSGVYERFFTVDGVRYHHIIDKDTLHPASFYDSVTVLCKNSGTADALSTALFCMDEEAGMKLAEEMNAQVLWVHSDGTKSMTPGMGDYIKEEGK
jgi:Membrane-associated lipoprotein involved in thiamine biosynthesis